jgi:uncharacterized membrane protein (DUF2068 family)
MKNTTKDRPLGVTIIAILTIIGGIGFLISGITAVGVAPFLPDLGILSAAIGAVLIALGIAYFVMAYGLWKGKGWAWTITLVLSFIGIVLGIASIVTGNIGALFHLIINIIVVYYLYRPNVKIFFGKSTTAMST